MNLERFAKIKETLVSLPQAAAEQQACYQNVPLLGSPASMEHSAFPGEQAVRTVYSQANTLLFSVADHMATLERVLTEPVMTFSPWTVSRTILEAASLAMWLLKVNIGGQVRVGRSMTLRLQDLNEELKIAHTSPGLESSIVQIEERISGLTSQAQRYGLPEKRNNKGKLLSFGESLPNGVMLAKQAFEAESIYRLLSASVHNRNWANQTLSMRLMPENQLAPDLPLEGALVLINSAVRWYARLIWNTFQLNGWDLTSLGEVLETQFNQAGIGERWMFWRSQ